MAIREYIGARYVTKIYENSLDPSSAEWEAGVTYEPLTLVTYNYSSYLSKKAVPGSVGDPASNPSYWVVTGAYNGQIATLQNEIDGIDAEIAILKGVWTTPEAYGAAGDGVTDDTAAFQDALDSGMNVYAANIYYISGSLTVPKNVNIVGSGTMKASFRGSTFVLSGYNSIDGLKFTDDQATDVTTGFIIYAADTDHISVTNCIFDTVGNGRCIMLDHCTDIDIRFNTFKNYGYSGVMLQNTCERANIEFNYLYNARYQGALHNYPISISAYDDSDHGCASHIKCNYNYIEEVTPHWEGIDSHGVKNCEIIGNTIKNVRYGIVMGYKRSSSLTAFADANNNLIIKNNYIIAKDTTAEGSQGIHIASADTNVGKNIEISGNYMDVSSNSTITNASASCITLRPSGAAAGVVIENNIMKCDTVHGISLDGVMFSAVSIRNNYFETLTNNFYAINLRDMDGYDGIELIGNIISATSGGNRSVGGPNQAPARYKLVECRDNDFAGLTFVNTQYATVAQNALQTATKAQGVTGQFIPKVGSDTVMGWMCQTAGSWYAISGTAV